jgi:hypothetical protein
MGRAEEDPADVVARCRRMRRSSSREPSTQNRDSAQLELSRGARWLHRRSLVRPTIAYASARMTTRAIASATEDTSVGADADEWYATIAITCSSWTASPRRCCPIAASYVGERPRARAQRKQGKSRERRRASLPETQPSGRHSDRRRR